MKTITLLFALLCIWSIQAQTYRLSEVDTAPVFAKGKMTSTEFLRYYLKYPKSAYDAGIEGVVTLSLTVDSDGMATDISVLKSLSPALDEEALRMASLLPFYTPAKKTGQNVAVSIQFPVTFKKENNNTLSTHSPAITGDNAPKNPLYVVDSKVLEKNANINPQNIKKIRIIKGQKAINLYGSRAKDGLILIDTK